MAELSDCYQPPHHYQAPQLACWPAAMEGGSLNGNPQAASTLYSPYLATPAARVGTPGMTGMGNPTEAYQVLAALAAATTAANASPATMKDSRWLTLEVCRQYQRKMCSRDENECKFAHPPPHVDVQNGRVICCYDSIKGKCQRRDPPCKYFHPPQHLRELLLQNGRNNLILKNMQLQLLQQQLAHGAIMPGLSAALAATGPTPSVASPGTVSTHGIAGALQCPNPTSSATSTPIDPTGKLIYSPSPSLNLGPQGVVTTYSLLLPQPTPPPPPSQPCSATVPTPATAAAAAAAIAANLDASSAQQLAHMFTPPKAALVDPLCAGLYTQAQTSTTTRKRLAACINDTVSAMYAPLFPASSVLAFGPHFDSALYQFSAQPANAANPLGVGLSPYLTPTQLNSMALAAALKSGPPTMSLANSSGVGAGGLSAAHLAAITAAAAAANALSVAPLAAPATPAKRPSLDNAKSCIPIFDYGQGLYALQAQAELMATKDLQLPPTFQPHSQSSLHPPQNSSATFSAGSGKGVKPETGNGGQEAGGLSVAELPKTQIVTVGQMYPETYIEIPQYGYQ